MPDDSIEGRPSRSVSLTKVEALLKDERKSLTESLTANLTASLTKSLSEKIEEAIKRGLDTFHARISTLTDEVVNNKQEISQIKVQIEQLLIISDVQKDEIQSLRNENSEQKTNW